MKTIRLILTLSLLPLLSNAQVGINTTTPTKDLDINGELRIRTTPNVVSSTSLTVDVDGNVGKSNNYVLYDSFLTKSQWGAIASCSLTTNNFE